MQIAEAFVEIRARQDQYDRDLAQIERKAEGTARSAAGKLGSIFGSIAVGAGIRKTIDAASNLQQAIGGTAAVFGEASGAIDEFAATSATSAGLSQRAARELTAQLGGLLSGFGFTKREAAGLSIQLAKLGADLAATFGGRPEEAVQALGAAIRGETDPIERYGIALNQTLVNNKAVSMGLAESTSAVDMNAKAQATLAIIMERSAGAQGQFARESDTAAGAAAITAAKTEDAAASMGDSLLPIYSKAVEVIGSVADGFGALPGPVQTGVIALAGLAAVLPRVLDGARAMRSVTASAADGLNRLRTASVAGTGATSALATGLRGLGAAGLVVGGVVALGNALTSAFDKDYGGNLTELENDLVRLAQGDAIENLGLDINGLSEAVDTLNNKENFGGNLLGDVLTLGGALGDLPWDVVDQAQEKLDGVDKVLARMAARNPAEAAAALEAIRQAMPTADFTRFRSELNDYDNAVTAADTATRSAEGSVDSLGGSAAGAAGGANTLAGAAASIGPAAASSVSGVTFLANAMALAFGDQIAVESAALGAARSLEALKPAASGAGGAMRDTAKDVRQAERAVRDAERGIQDAAEGVEDANKRIAESHRDVQEAVEGVTEAQDRLREAEKDLREARRSASAEDVDRAGLDIEQARLSQVRSADRVKDAEEALREAREEGDPDKIHDAELDLQEARIAAREATYRIGDAEDRLAEIRKKGTDQDEAVVAAQERVAEARDGVTEANDRVTEANERVLEAQEELEDAEYRVIEADEALADAHDRVKEAAEGSGGAAGGAARSHLDLQAALLAAKNAHIDWAKALAEEEIRQREANGETVNAQTAQRILKEKLEQVASTLAPGSPLRIQLEEYIRKLDELDGREVTTTVKVKYLGNPVGNPEAHPELFGPKGRALGGSIAAGDVARVGEAGPELVQFGQSGTVIPNHDLGRGGVTVESMTVIVDSPREFYDETLWRVAG